METHGDDPREEEAERGPSDEAWRQASEQFSALGSKLRSRYSDIVGDDGPAEEDVRQAFTTIGTAAQSLVESISESMRDPDVRDHLKEATSTFFSAIGQTLSQLGEELASDDGGLDDEHRDSS